MSNLNPNQFDYRIRHRAPGPSEVETDAPNTQFHDPTDMMPDVHEHPEYYEHMRPRSLGRETVQQLHAARGNPEHDVTIYRAVPKSVQHIHPGDWVTSSRNYALQHARSELPEDDGAVISARTKAKHLYTEGELHEWGYHGPESLRAT